MEHADALASAANARTLNDLIETIPRPYRSALRCFLARRHRIARRHALVSLTLSSHQRHIRHGTFPPSIGRALKVSLVRITDEFLATPQYTLTTINLHDGVLTARKAALQNAIEQKKAELDFLSTLPELDFPTWDKVWKRLVLNVASGITQAYGGIVVQDSEDLWYLTNVSATANSEFVTTLKSSAVYAARVLSLARAVGSRNFGGNNRPALVSST